MHNSMPIQFRVTIFEVMTTEEEKMKGTMHVFLPKTCCIY